MTIDEIVTLIQAVSDNGLTSFEYEEGDQKLVLKKKAEKTVVPAPVLAELSAAEKTVVEKAEPVTIDSDNVVMSPLVGTFYSASSPDAEPFVKVGDTVKKGQILGIIEAMKLMNDIECEFDGTIKEIFVKNGQTVEYGQPLFLIG